MRLEIVSKNIWCSILNTDFATCFSDAINGTLSSVGCFDIDWNSKRFNLVSSFTHNLNSILNFIDNALFEQDFHCYLFLHINVSFHNMICNFLQIDWLKVVIIVKSSCSETSLWESDFLLSLTTFKSSVNLTTSSSICTFVTTTGCFSLSTSLTSTKFLWDSSCSWVVPNCFEGKVKIFFVFYHSFSMSSTSTGVVNRSAKIQFGLPILSWFLERHRRCEHSQLNRVDKWQTWIELNLWSNA